MQRRKQTPKRAITPPLDVADKINQRIVSLDVYSTFHKNPKLLLGVKRKLMDTRGAPNVSWKGALANPAGSQPLILTPDLTDYQALTPEEIQTCSTLRIYPSQYLNIKQTMLNAVSAGPFKKREAQTWFRIDVNKVGRIYTDLHHLRLVQSNGLDS
jgi:hypothetical protein